MKGKIDFLKSAKLFLTLAAVLLATIGIKETTFAIEINPVEVIESDSISENDIETIELIESDGFDIEGDTSFLGAIQNNVNAHNYGGYAKRWATPVYTYLQKTADNKLMLVRGGTDSGIVIKYYDSNYNEISSKTVSQDLPLFGCFYCDGSNYYIVTGQKNASQSSSLVVIMVTKYDTNWNKIKSVGISDINTVAPFEAGSCRAVSKGNDLFIRTCHKMYVSSDGLNHQSCMTFRVNTSSMTFTDRNTAVMNSSAGYVSHSFNQFIGIDGDKLVAVDHGDAYPRNISMSRYKESIASGKKFLSSWSNCTNINVKNVATGSIGANATGVTVDGFEIADSVYFVAGTSCPDGATTANCETTPRNIYVSAINKSNNSVSLKWITTDATGPSDYNEPHLITTSNGTMLIYSKGETIYYTYLNKDGSAANIKTMSGYLSDVKPIEYNGKIVWCVSDGTTEKFYSISDRKVDVNQVKAFVNRIYEIGLNRKADETGLNDWTNRLTSGKSTGAEVASGFFFSDEMTKRNLSDEDFVETLYKVMMNRSSDAGGKADWINKLQNGVTREGVYAGFAASQEFTNICDTYGITRGTYTPSKARDKNPGLTTYVARLYTKALGRPYEDAGIEYWCNQILTGKYTIDSASTTGFFFSEEFTNKKMNNSDFVNTLYATFFDREADKAGYDDWINRLNNGASRADVLKGFTNSQEYYNLKKSYGLVR